MKIISADGKIREGKRGIVASIKGLLYAIYFLFLYRFIIKPKIKMLDKPTKILQSPDPRLKLIAEPVKMEGYSNLDREELLKIFRTMLATLQSQKFGMKLGISAPQIGINKRLMIVNGTPMINPVWQRVKKPKITAYEACYSLNGKDIYSTERDEYGFGTWYNLKGERVNCRVRGIHSIVYQHQLGHLNGVCCDTTGEKYESKVEGSIGDLIKTKPE